MRLSFNPGAQYGGRPCHLSGNPPRLWRGASAGQSPNLQSFVKDNPLGSREVHVATLLSRADRPKSPRLRAAVAGGHAHFRLGPRALSMDVSSHAMNMTAVKIARTG